VFGPFWFEISGVAMFLGSVFVLWFGTSAMPTRWRPIRRAALIAFAYIMCAATFAVATRDVWVPPPQGVVKIAVFVPTEGPYALLGDSFVKAVRMAHDDLKNTKYRYELVVGDSSADPRLAEERVRRLLDVEDIDAVVGGISLIGQVTKRHTTAARIPHLCVCTVMWIGDGGYNFTNIPSPEAEAALWAHEAQRRGVKTVAFITQDYPSINNHVKTVKLEAARVGIKVTDEQRLDGSVTDFRSPISRAQRVSPDVYYIEALEPSLSALGRELSRAGIRNISSVVTPSLSDRPELFEGTWYTDSNLRDLAFKRRFEEKYPATRFATHMMPYAYDSVNMIVRAFESEQNPAVYLRKLQAYDGTAGPLTKARASGNFASTPAVWAIANGKPVLLHH
jgi:ABC-type branched-subunit amino acid transport system substrate-binding protein